MSVQMIESETDFSWEDAASEVSRAEQTCLGCKLKPFCQSQVGIHEITWSDYDHPSKIARLLDGEGDKYTVTVAGYNAGDENCALVSDGSTPKYESVNSQLNFAQITP